MANFRFSHPLDTNVLFSSFKHLFAFFCIQVLDQLDKKRKAVMDQKEKGEKILKDPKAPKFLSAHMDKLNALWADANKCAESRLKQLKGKQNLTSSVISTQ